MTTVTVSFRGAELEVTGHFTPVIPAVIYAPVELCHPEEGGKADIESICIGGVDVTDFIYDVVTRDALQDIEDRAWEKAMERRR